jgi:hypothetical protein
MWQSLVQIGLAAAIALSIFTAFAEGAPVQPETRPSADAAAVNPDEGWSADDIKDVFEGIQFFMFSVGVGAALYWFWFQYMPSKRLPRIEFDVAVENVGENDAAWIVEIVALVKNLGGAPAELTELRFSAQAILADALSANSGSLVKMDALTPLFEGEWAPATLVLDPGTQTRRACAAAVPKTVKHVVVTATARNAKRTEVYEASRLVLCHSGKLGL